MKKQLTALILITSMLCALCATAFPIGATVETPSEIALEPRHAVMDDALVILIHLAKIELLSEEEQVPLDLNYNSKIDIGDMLIVLMGLANIIPRPMIVPVYVEPNLPVETTESPATTTEPPKGGLEPLSKELELRIKTDWLEYKGRGNDSIDDAIINRYFGTYNGNVAIMIHHRYETFAQSIWNENVAGYEFCYGTNQRILIWNDGILYRLSRFGTFDAKLSGAYEEGLLTTKNIGNIWYYYNYRELEPLEPLSEELELRIASDLLEQIGKGRGNVDDYMITKYRAYLGTYNGSVAFMWDGAGLTITGETVAGYEFVYPNTGRILVWNDGGFYRISERGGTFSNLPSAYAEELLTEQNIADIHFHYYNSRN